MLLFGILCYFVPVLVVFRVRPAERRDVRELLESAGLKERLRAFVYTIKQRSGHNEPFAVS